MSAYDVDAPVPLMRPPAPYPFRPYEPSGDVQPPLVLVEGPAKVGKTAQVVEATRDPRICHTWWIEWGVKPCVAEYGGSIPGADLEIVPHDGGFWSVLSLLRQITALAREKVSRDGAPMVVIDSGAAEWKALRDIAHHRTLSSPSVRRKIARDPLARADSHPIPSNTWHDVNDLHDEFMALLKDFPGIAVIITRGGEVAAFDDSGQLIPGEKTYKVEGHRSLVHDCSAWVRMSPTGQHHIHGLTSGRAFLRPDCDGPHPFDGIPELVFDLMGYEPKPWEPDLRIEELRQLQAGEPRPPVVDWETKLAEADQLDIPADRKAALNDLWKAARFHQQQRPGTVSPQIIARIEKAGSEAAEALRVEWEQAWDEAHAEPPADPAEAPVEDPAPMSIPLPVPDAVCGTLVESETGSLVQCGALLIPSTDTAPDNPRWFHLSDRCAACWDTPSPHGNPNVFASCDWATKHGDRLCATPQPIRCAACDSVVNPEMAINGHTACTAPGIQRCCGCCGGDEPAGSDPDALYEARRDAKLGVTS